jgi:hypothetical protein
MEIKANPEIIRIKLIANNIKRKTIIKVENKTDKKRQIRIPNKSFNLDWWALGSRFCLGKVSGCQV